ncbi:MAG: molybdenum cofactor biosynthesis protein MoaE [Planctomycetota bacterium]
MRVTVLLFAACREAAGRDRVELELDAGADLAALRRTLVGRWPALDRVPFVFAHNLDYAAPDTPLAEGDEVALVPAISGGSGEGGGAEARVGFELVEGPLDPRALEAEVRRDSDGAVVTFLGVTRDHHEGSQVLGLAYECFEDMARRRMLAILAEVLAGHELGRIAVRHRLGEVPIGEASVVVVVSAPHRGPAFDAAREVMDRLKREVPIFQKERLADGGERWVGELPQA